MLKKILYIIIMATIVVLIKYALADDCAKCGKAVMDKGYRIVDTDEVICERCYKSNRMFYTDAY